MEIQEDIFIQNLGIHIRKLRESKDLSQNDLSINSDIPKIQIGRIERAEINTTVRTLVKIANALQIDPKELFNFSSPKDTNTK